MPELQIQIKGHLPESWRPRIPFEVLDVETFQRFDQTSVPGQVTKVTVPAGDYQITAYLPSGRSLSTKRHVTDGRNERVDFQAADERTFDAELESTPVAKNELFHVEKWLDDNIRLRNGTGNWIELTFWHARGRDRYSRIAAPRQSVCEGLLWHNHKDGYCCLGFELENGTRPVWMRVTVEEREQQIVALPPSTRLHVAVGRSMDERALSPRIIPSSDNIHAEALLAYLHHGSKFAAGLLTPGFVNEQMVAKSEWKTELTGAAVAAYSSLGLVEKPPRMAQWLSAIARTVEWFPDITLIEIGHLIAQDKEKVDLRKIRGLLLEAWHRGIPLYTDGLRRFAKMLAYLCQRPDGLGAELQKVKCEIERLSMFADPSVATTTFRMTDGALKSRPMLRFDQ